MRGWLRFLLDRAQSLVARLAYRKCYRYSTFSESSLILLIRRQQEILKARIKVVQLFVYLL
jgi:hypothetical protein